MIKKLIILNSLTNIKNYCIEEIQNIIKLSYDDIRNNYSIDLYGSFTNGSHDWSIGYRY